MGIRQHQCYTCTKQQAFGLKTNTLLKASGGKKSAESSYSSRKELRTQHIIFIRQRTILEKMMRSNKMCLDGISGKLDTVDCVGIPPSPMHMLRKPPDLRWWISPIHIRARKNYWFFTDMEMAR
jgi:hypothetical protein